MDLVLAVDPSHQTGICRGGIQGTCQPPSVGRHVACRGDEWHGAGKEIEVPGRALGATDSQPSTPTGDQSEPDSRCRSTTENPDLCQLGVSGHPVRGDRQHAAPQRTLPSAVTPAHSFPPGPRGIARVIPILRDKVSHE